MNLPEQERGEQIAAADHGGVTPGIGRLRRPARTECCRRYAAIAAHIDASLGAGHRCSDCPCATDEEARHG
ncbi:hypothetical protein [Paraconexibacter algicola]|uniref:Uncharacterized protein n=1 Tax=Paraconexibacter algicola TaxID=2133960 RepID=A0A2T4UE42_9ACTN|nr:hypothetical protein [Paraconexibacter algicola]PTL55770.1 hypothetical protein C7Y72_19265 [Paraconexibacter algicola]